MQTLLKTKYYISIFTVCFRRPAGSETSLRLSSGLQFPPMLSIPVWIGLACWPRITFFLTCVPWDACTCIDFHVCIMARMHIACWPRITFFIHAYYGMRARALTFTCAPWDACTRTDFHMCTMGFTHMHWLSHVHHGIHAHALTFTCVPWVTCTGNDFHMCIMGCMHLHSFTCKKQMYPILYIFAPNTVNSNSIF